MAKRRRRNNGEGTLIAPRPEVSRFWAVQLWENGRQIRRSTKSETKSGAIAFLDELKRQQRTGIFTAESSKLCYGDIRQLFVQDRAEQNRHSPERDVRRLDEFFGWSETSSGWRVNRITVDAINQFKTKRAAVHATPATINRSLAALHRMFKLAVEQQKLSVQQVPLIKLLAEPTQPRSGFLEFADYERLLSRLPEYLHPVVAFGYYTGVRLGAILALRWEWVDLNEDHPCVNFPPGIIKNRKPLRVPLNIGGLPEMLEKIRQKNATAELVFLAPDGMAIVDFRKAWRAACIAASLETELFERRVKSHFSKGDGCCSFCDDPQVRKFVKPAPGKYFGLIFHDLRRTAARDLVRAGVPETVAMKVTGHRTRSIFDRYNIASAEDVEQAMEARQRYIETQKRQARQPRGRLKVVLNQ